MVCGLTSEPPGIGPGALVPEGASILGFSQSLGCKTIYKNVYSGRDDPALHPDSETGYATYLFDLTVDRYFGEGHP
jgi:hypothetical protein